MTNASAAPAGFADPSAFSPNIVADIRYATSNNFTGKPVPGYAAPRCWLRIDVARALAAAADEVAALGYRLVVYDCYRPERAVRAFIAWAKDPAEQSTKDRFYPDIEKPALLGTYIGEKSQHSAGVAVDVGLQRADGSAVDFGTEFDFFGPQSATKNATTPEVRKHRRLLVRLMQQQGFRNYPQEWWHFSFPLRNARPMDVPIE